MGQKEQIKAVAQVTKGKVDPAYFGWTQFKNARLASKAHYAKLPCKTKHVKLKGKTRHFYLHARLKCKAYHANLS